MEECQVENRLLLAAIIFSQNFSIRSLPPHRQSSLAGHHLQRSLSLLSVLSLLSAFLPSTQRMTSVKAKLCETINST